MAVENPTDVEEKNILYDLSIHAEWPQETESTNRPARTKVRVPISTRLTSAVTMLKNVLTRLALMTANYVHSSVGGNCGCRGLIAALSCHHSPPTDLYTVYAHSWQPEGPAWTLLRSLGLSFAQGTPCVLAANFVKHVNSQINWHFAVTKDHSRLAVLQDDCLEILHTEADTVTLLGRYGWPKRDSHPQWRRLAWSDDGGDYLACSHSNGTVEVFDVVANRLAVITTSIDVQPNAPHDLSSAICALVFKPGKSANSNLELMIINYTGFMRTVSISMSGQVEVVHTFTFPSSVSCVLSLPSHAVLLVGGSSTDLSDAAEAITAETAGITAWRVLSDFPHLKQLTDYEHDKRSLRKRQLLKKISGFSWRNYWSGTVNDDSVYCMCVSPDSSRLATVHQSGRYSHWELPSLRLIASWQLDAQPGYDDINQEIAGNPKKRKTMKEHLNAFWLSDSNWWSDEAVLLARGTGAVMVCSAITLQNLLGASPEWFAPAPKLSQAADGGFLGLECECKYESLKRRLAEESDSEFEDSEDEEDRSIVAKTTLLVKQALYYVTDNEKFQPPRKRPKLVTKTYRLLCLKSTTPEEMYARKIDNEEYGEALELAKAYNLDCDKVYQRQWKKTPVSVASIQDYLSKISKRSWVLHECVERVPDNLDAMKELLLYGLRGTDMEALISIGKGEDGGRFIHCDRLDVFDESIDPFDTEAIEEQRIKQHDMQNLLLKQIDFSKLSLDQRELLRARQKLVMYLDRLNTYEEILGGSHVAVERYQPQFFAEFRQQNIVELAVDYARKYDWQALEVLFTYHGDDLLAHRLGILTNFPETFAPIEYKTLLPEVCISVDPAEVVGWTTLAQKNTDWVEKDYIRKAIDPTPVDLGAFMYEENPDLKPFVGSPLSVSQVSSWYQYRACQIEKLAQQVDHALELVQLAIEKFVPDLDGLLDDLNTMETLVYECRVDDEFTLDDLRSTPNIDRVRLIMAKSSQEMYVKNVRRWLVPYLERVEKKEPGAFLRLVHEYLVSMATTDLSLCLKMFQTSKANQPKPVISDDNALISMALDCIYACESTDQLSNAYSILECLPRRGFGTVSSADRSSSTLHGQVDELECHLRAADILQAHNAPQLLAFIKSTQHDSEQAQALMIKVSRTAGRKNPPLTEAEWRKLLSDLIELRTKVYTCVEVGACYEILVASLLTSSRVDNIKLAGKMLETSARESAEPDYEGDQGLKVHYDRAVQLVLQAAREYFDSSANLKDPCMELARACLALIKDSHVEIKEEQDLIDSIQLLADCGVSILPLQVRMCEERLDLVEKAIKARQYTYKNAQALLKLGELLRVPGKENERRGKVLRLVAQAAIQAGDWRIAQETCTALMLTGHAPCWQECKALAQAEPFKDVHFKLELLSFSVTHCSGEMIEPILKAKNLLETQILYDQLHTDMSSERSSESPFSARGAIQHTKEILSTTNKATKAVLSSVSDPGWWKKTLDRITPKAREEEEEEEEMERNQQLLKQACHPFYATVIAGEEDDTIFVDESVAPYRRRVQEPSFSETVLRTGKLEETLTGAAAEHPATQVLLQLAADTIQQDFTLGLAYLLALPKAIDADACLSQLPSTGVSLQLATYHYALQIYRRLSNDMKTGDDVEGHHNVDPVYLYPPADVTRRVLRHVQTGQSKIKDEETKLLIEKLQESSEMLIDLAQAHRLQELDRDVDINRFTSDDEYKRETILGLAMTEEHQVYELALSLADRYSIPKFDVYMAHLEYLFDTGLSTEELDGRVRKLDIFQEISSNGEAFISRMQQYVYPSLDGTDHARLLYYYTLLDTTESEAGVQDHIKLLKKLRPLAPDVDYKKLVDGKHNPLEVIQPVLTQENINGIAKLAPKIPNQKGGCLQSSVVHCGWATKQFWDPVNAKKQPQTHADWVHRYESVGEFAQKLLPEDHVQFINGIVFTQPALDKLSNETRHELVRRALKYSRGRHKKQAQGEMAWEDVSTTLQGWLSHLEAMDRIRELPSMEGDQKFVRTIDLTRGEQDKVEKCLVSALVTGQDLGVIHDILQVIPQGAWNIQTAVKDTLTLLTQAIRQEESVEGSSSSPEQLLHGVITQVSTHSSVVDVDVLLCVLRAFCADVSVDVPVRLRILQMLETCFTLSDTDLSLLILYRTQAVMAAVWPDTQVCEADIVSDSNRHKLFTDLLEASTALDQFKALATLLEEWPPLEASNTSDPSSQPWCSLLGKMADTCKSDCGKDVVAIGYKIRQKMELSPPCVSAIFHSLKASELGLSAVKWLLIFEHDDLFPLAVTEIQQHETETKDEELVVLLLKRHLVAEIVTTPFYPQCVDFILANQTEDTPYYLQVETVSNQLYTAGHGAEAGSLVLRHRATHSSLATFDVAVGMISRWFSR